MQYRHFFFQVWKNWKKIVEVNETALPIVKNWILFYGRNKEIANKLFVINVETVCNEKFQTDTV